MTVNSVTALPSIDIRGKGDCYSLVVNGQRLPRRFWSYDNAAVAAQRLEERAINGLQQDRPCICCGENFLSGHRFHRLCGHCSSLGWSY